jgi:hypothetical protein
MLPVSFDFFSLMRNPIMESLCVNSISHCILEQQTRQIIQTFKLYIIQESGFRIQNTDYYDMLAFSKYHIQTQF